MALGSNGRREPFASVERRFRTTFYKHCAMHNRNTWWCDRTTLEIDGKIVTGCERELVQAHQGMAYARCYWPMDLAEPFVRENWCVGVARARCCLIVMYVRVLRSRWEQEKPWWFDDAWQARIPPNFLVGIDHAHAPASQQEEAFRAAVHNTEPWALGAKDLTKYLQELWVNANDESDSNASSSRSPTISRRPSAWCRASRRRPGASRSRPVIWASTACRRW